MASCSRLSHRRPHHHGTKERPSYEGIIVREETKVDGHGAFGVAEATSSRMPRGGCSPSHGSGARRSCSVVRNRSTMSVGMSAIGPFGPTWVRWWLMTLRLRSAYGRTSNQWVISAVGVPNRATCSHAHLYSATVLDVVIPPALLG